MNKNLIAPLILVCCAGVSAAQQALTPRDAFWSASDLVDVAANPATQNRKTAAPPTTPQTHDKKAMLIASKGYGQAPHLVRYQKAVQQPLGLRYALLKVGPSGELTEVLAKTTFYSGDKLKISLMANQGGYIYIIQQGSSGTWKALFPAQGGVPESNRVEAGMIYQIPAERSFQFNDQTGSEHVFILLSRQAVSDLDGVIFNLRQGQKEPSGPPEAAPPQVEASNTITDALIQQLKSRDLMEVEDPPQEAKDSSLGENAMYVVSQGKGDNAASQVFANLVLDHR